MTVLAAALAALASGLYGPLSTLGCRLRGEPFYAGKPASSWSKELAGWYEYQMASAVGYMGSFDWSKVPVQWGAPIPAWERWTMKHVPQATKYLPTEPRILEGDVAALPVLLVLLEDPNPKVRRVAISGLRRLGREGAPVVPALRKRSSDPDEQVAHDARAALDSIAAVRGLELDEGGDQ